MNLPTPAANPGVLQWPATQTPPLGRGVIRSQPEDFQVDELMDIEPEGEGEHVWLKIRKTGFNTDYVAGLLARQAELPRKAVGYAGMKDRHAVTTQWFSVHLPGRSAPDWSAGLPSGIELVESTRHRRKLQTGALTGNRFRIVLRQAQGDRAALCERVAAIRATGVPNYFGEQRFGHNGENLAKAEALFKGGGKAGKPRNRKLGGIYLSAVRAWLFNELLAERVRAGSWDRGLPGDVFMLAGSRSFFLADTVDPDIERRLREGDIHPSGPLWGRGVLPSEGAVKEMEQALIGRYPVYTQGLEEAGLRQERRALRVLVSDLTAHWLDEGETADPGLDRDAVRFEFELPAGSYATAVLRELVCYDVAESQRSV